MPFHVFEHDVLLFHISTVISLEFHEIQSFGVLKNRTRSTLYGPKRAINSLEGGNLYPLSTEGYRHLSRMQDDVNIHSQQRV